MLPIATDAYFRRKVWTASQIEGKGRGEVSTRPSPPLPCRYNKSVMDLVQIEPARRVPAPKPEWLKARAPVGENYHDLKRLARSLGLHTVCESAHCPNIGECWHHKTATFMMLGNLCTRRCGFCAVPKGRPEPIDFDEPRRVAEAVATLGLQHAVITSVNRDDDLVGGAAHLRHGHRRNSPPGARLPRRSADPRFSGKRRSDQDSSGCAPRRS